VVRLVVGLVSIVASVSIVGSAQAQTYTAGVSSSGQQNCNNSGSSQSNGNGGDSSGLFGDSSNNSQQGSCGPGYQQGATATQGSSSTFSPVTIPQNTTQTQPNSQPIEDLRVTTPADNATSTPLFARPTGNNGAFELYRRPPPPLNEFEKFVNVTLGRTLPRFGSSLVLNGGRGFAAPATTTVPADYALNPGDELLIGVTGSVEAELRLVIDSQGRIFVPKLGEINVAGIRYGDLQAALLRRFNEQYKEVKISAVVSRLHGVTVYVTGYAVSPGAYVVSSISTMIDAVLHAGGPSDGGSFRTIELRRSGRLVTTLDLYDLLLRGDTSHDAVLQNGDVLNIAPVGPESAVTGSVNSEGIYEAKAGETIGDLIRYAGGPATLADDSRIFVARLANADKTGWEELTVARATGFPAERGDIVRLVSRAPIAEPQERQAVLVSIEGEVERPGRYYLRPGATMGEVVASAGGLTTGAFVYGTELDRDSVKRQQQISFDKAIDDLELAAAAAPLQSLSSSSDRAAQDQSRQQSAIAIIERLKQHKPDGRLVIELPYTATTLPDRLTLENNDRIYVPARPTTIGVFGAVYRPGSFLYTGARLSDYLKLAGGPEKYADAGDLFVVHANGSVVSHRIDKDLASLPALPGDVLFVPVRTTEGLLQRLVDIANIVFSVGLGAATIRGLVG
jgi:protein involved in polysaccharide export with SLBB domain